MNIVTTRFGQVQVPEKSLVRFPEGLVGFGRFTDFVLFPDPETADLLWLQSTQAAGLAFALVSPQRVVPGFELQVRASDVTSLGLDDPRAALVYVILNRVEGRFTVNLQGPLAINPQKGLGRQLVLTSSRYAVRHPLEAPAKLFRASA